MAGGLVGQLKGDIRESYSLGSTVSKTGAAGGLVGNTTSTAKIENSYVRGNVEGGDRTGGLIGESSSKLTEIKNCYIAVEMSGKGINAIAGGFNPPTTTDSYIDGEVTGQKGTKGLTAKTTAEMQTASTYEGWSTDVWNLVDGQYPTLK